MTSEISEISELSEFIDFLKYSFKSKIKKKKELHIIFKLYDKDANDIYKIIYIYMNNNTIDISYIDNSFNMKIANCIIIIKLDTFLTIFHKGITIFGFCKKVWKKQIKTEKFSYSKYKKFTSCFDNFSHKQWNKYYEHIKNKS